MVNFEALQQILQTPQKIIIIPHRKPDADALGSCLGLAGYLKKYNHQVHVVSPTDYPKFLNWMSGNSEVLVYDKENESKIDELIHQADLIFCLDFSSTNRIEGLSKPLSQTKGKIVLIDHHRGKEDFADFELHNIKASSTAELIYDFIHLFEDHDKIDIPIGEALYAGIMTDTGSFKYPSTSSKVHRIAADLIDFGIDAPKIHRLIFDNNSVNRIKFLGYALDRCLTILPEFNTAYFAITLKDLEAFDSQTGDTEGIVNYALSAEGIALAAMFIERQGGVKMSFRSIGDFSVAEMASKHFNGGGHANAAGGITEISLKETVQLFKNLLPQNKEALALQAQKKAIPEG